MTAPSSNSPFWLPIIYDHYLRLDKSSSQSHSPERQEDTRWGVGGALQHQFYWKIFADKYDFHIRTNMGIL